jgi:hypothetical protein
MSDAIVELSIVVAESPNHVALGHDGNAGSNDLTLGPILGQRHVGRGAEAGGRNFKGMMA